ncbi:unnamed protein product [Mucor hiemalis]
MSYLTKEQLENYLNELPSNNNNKSKTEYDQVKSELLYPMQKLAVEDEQDASYSSIQDRMKRLRTATGTVLSTTQSQAPAYPQTPKPTIPTKPSFSSDAFEASLNPRLHGQRRQQPQNNYQQQATASVQKQQYKTPPSPPPVPALHSPSTPPPAVPNSPRPPRPSSNDKVRTLNPIYAGLTCPGCDKEIEGSVVSAMERIWHDRCFKCTSCHKTLENEQYFEKDDKPYCGKDYRKLFSLHCDFCHEPIENSAINALGKHYHEDHFCCTACRKPFGDKAAFMVHEDKPYCQDDYMKICGKKCSGCGQYISGEYINALEQEWHKGCFTCTDCKSPFTNGSFLVKDNKPYCEEHYHHPLKKQQERYPPAVKPKPPLVAKKPDFPPKKINTELGQDKKPEFSSPNNSGNRSSRIINTSNNNPSKKTCHHCKSIIDGPCATGLGHDYHVHHFQCSVCSRALSSRVPGMWQGDSNGELVCKMCAFKSSQT